MCSIAGKCVAASNSFTASRCMCPSGYTALACESFSAALGSQNGNAQDGVPSETVAGSSAGALLGFVLLCVVVAVSWRRYRHKQAQQHAAKVLHVSPKDHSTPAAPHTIHGAHVHKTGTVVVAA